MQFSKKAAQKSVTPIHYLAGDDGKGNDCFWFIMCSSENYEELERKFKTKGVNLTDYGIIVASGWGKVPSEETKNKLINEYNVNWEDYAGVI